MSELLNVTKTAQRVGLSRRRVNQLIDAGQLKASWTGSQWVISSIDLDDWRKYRKRRPGRPAQ